jgi:hypothetical protein
MATPNSTEIVNDLVTALSAISVAGGYKTDVETVSRTVKTWDEATQRPEIGVGKQPVIYEPYAPNCLRCTMQVSLVAHILNATEAGRLTAVENLLDDIIKAIYTDHTRSSNAIDTKILRSDDDLGVGHSVTHQGYGASLLVELECKWDRTTSGS